MEYINTSGSKAPFIKTAAVSILMIFSFSWIYAAQDYADALYKSVYYYGAQRCGDTKSWIHGACHLQDGQVNGIDLTGGWHDCGDYVKFGQTNSYAAALLLLGYIYFPSAYEDRYSQDYSAPPPNGIPDILDEVKIHTDYLLKAYQSGTVYYQVGDGTADHKHFVTPEYQSTAYTAAEGGNPRPVYSITSGGSNVCGTAAAALALMSIAYKPYNSAYAAQCLTAAINYYNVGKTNPGALSAPGGFYNASHWAGQMAWGAIELYRATGTASYLTDAETFSTNGDYSMPTNWVLCWNNCEPVADLELYKLTGTATYLTKLQSEVSSYEGKMTTCGIGSYATVNNWGNLRYTGDMALMGAFLDSVTSGGDANALSMCKKSVDFILGTHGPITSDGAMPGPGAAQGESFIIGYTDPDYPSAGWVLHPHHRAAFGKTTTGDTDFATESANPGTVSYAHTLIGSLPGGPQNACGSFDDNIGQYSQTEGGIDYNAGIVGAIAAIKCKYGPTQTVTPTFTFTPAATRTYTRTATASATATFTFTATNTPSKSATPTMTFTPTSTYTMTFTPTFTPTVSKTATKTVTFTPTFTVTYSPTFTFTATSTNSPTFTITMTATNAPPDSTNTFTSTVTSTITNTFTSTMTCTLTYTGTSTATATFTDIPSLSATLTATYTKMPSDTMTATSTNTPPGATFTFTATKTLTFTVTMSFTPTLTQSPTAQPSVTDTPSPVASYTATTMPTKTPTPAAPGIYPNPFDPQKEDLHVVFAAAADSTDVELKIYTVAFRLVRKASLGNATAGVVNDKTVMRYRLNSLSKGLYYYVLEFNSSAGVKYSKISELLVAY